MFFGELEVTCGLGWHKQAAGNSTGRVPCQPTNRLRSIHHHIAMLPESQDHKPMDLLPKLKLGIRCACMAANAFVFGAIIKQGLIY